jgi:DNA-binding transcriptional ArsR family regulator
MLGQRFGLPRQKVNYHLKALERHGLVELVEERHKVNEACCAPRRVRMPSRHSRSPRSSRTRQRADRLSARWLLAVATRLVRDVGALITGATQANRRLATFALDREVLFASGVTRSPTGIDSPRSAHGTAV